MNTIMNHKAPPLKINSKETTPFKRMEDFEDLMEEIFEEKSYLLEYARLLDAKSTVTFHHSVNVALMTYSELKKDTKLGLTNEDIKKYVAGVFCHKEFYFFFEFYYYR